jgi:hypothetical protein
MKQILRLSVVVGLMTFGLASQALAVPSLQIVGCQGTICVAGAIQSPGPINFTGIVVGDYTVSGSGAAFESAAQSQVAQTTIQVSRTAGTTNTTPLDVYVIATGYNLPNPPGTLSSTHAASYTNIGGAPNTASSVSFIGWISTTNSTLGGLPGAPGAFVGPVTLPGGLQTNGLIACTPTPNVGSTTGSCNIDGAVTAVNPGAAPPFSLITRTTFNVPTGAGSAGDLYGSTSQVDVFQQAVVPEPASMLLLGTGLLGVARAARRRRTR